MAGNSGGPWGGGGGNGRDSGKEGGRKQPTGGKNKPEGSNPCLLYTSPSPRDLSTSRMPSSA